MVTLSGVVLGIAFLMSTVTTQFINRAVAQEREARQQLNLMANVVRTQIGAIAGKTLAVAVCGALSPVESDLLDFLRAAQPAGLRIHGPAPEAPPSAFARGASAVLLLGDAPQCPVPLATLTEGMITRLVIDSRTDRACEPDATVRRETIFNRQVDDQREREAHRAAGERFRTLWIVLISLAVTVIGVANALLMSVTERFREIGTMKCLGALSSFIRRLFLIESALIGLAGSVLGVLAGTLMTMGVYGCIYGFALVFGTIAYGALALAGVAATLAGAVLAVLAALYPAHFASRMVPAAALRSTV
ncbi:MAG: ABC transporter permease [Lentisphaerae bacterium]|nr:ABC transporter permease [Lentisphaerota bacterium]